MRDSVEEELEALLVQYTKNTRAQRSFTVEIDHPQVTRILGPPDNEQTFTICSPNRPCSAQHKLRTDTSLLPTFGRKDITCCTLHISEERRIVPTSPIRNP